MADRERTSSRQRDADESFLRRWSRRKAETRSAPTPAMQDPGVPAEAVPVSREQPQSPDKRAPAAIDPQDLPDPDSLDASSDFTVFMRPGVPEHLRTLALRKLWRSDPIFSKLDGLVEYGEDYSIASWPKGTVKTAYEVGRGFLERISEGTERPDQASPPAPVEEPAGEPGRIAAATGEPLPLEPASLRESGSPPEPVPTDQKDSRPTQASRSRKES